jgi:hypothetical protein
MLRPPSPPPTPSTPSLIRACGPRPALRGVLALFIIALAIFGLTPQLHAQGATGTTPDPITATDFEHYCHRLSMSDEQIQAALSMHERYKTAFAKLRAGEIEDFLQEHGELSAFSFSLDQEALNKKSKALSKVLDRIRTVDNRLFDEVQALLTEAQVERMPRVRQARERDRFRGSMPMLGLLSNPAASVDLSRIIDDMELPEDVYAAINPQLAEYERRLTAETRALADMSLNQGSAMAQRLADKQFNAESLSDPEQAGAAIDAMFQAMNEIREEMNTKLNRVAALNRRTMRELGRALPTEHADALARRFYARAYHQAPGRMNGVLKRLTYAFETAELTEEQRAQLEAIEAAFRIDIDSALTAVMDALDEERLSPMLINPTEEDMTRQTKRQEAVQDAQDRRDGVINTAMESIDAVLGEDLAQRIAARIDAEDDEESEMVTETAVSVVMIAGSAGGEGGMAVSTFSSSVELDATNIFPGSGHDPVAAPMTLEEYRRCTRPVRLGPGDRSIADTIFDDYRDTCHEATESTLAALRAIEDNQWAVDPDTGEVTPPSNADLQRAADLRASVMRSIQEQDEQFFNDLITVFGEDDDRARRIDRARCARQRAVYARAIRNQGGPMNFSRGGGGGRAMIFFGGGESDEASIDVSTIVGELDLPDAAYDAIDPALAEYELAVTDIFRRYYETSQDIERQTQALTARFAERSGDDDRRGMSIEADDDIMRSIEQQRELVRAARAEIMQRNRALLDTLDATLASDTAHRLRRNYDRAAYPQVFRARRPAEDQIKTALAFDDLTDDQRGSIQEAFADYLAQWEALSDELVAIHRAAAEGDDQTDEGDFNFSAMQERQREIERVRFERNDLDAAAIARLRAILTDEQAERIGRR